MTAAMKKSSVRPSNGAGKPLSGQRSGFATLLALCLSFSAAAVQAGEADVLNGQITALGDGKFRIDATVLHEDDGWDHYADRWDVLSEDGQLLGSRPLAHPHDNEQPFTRSLTLTLPEGTRAVMLQAHDSVHGLGGKVFKLVLP